jgi:hypothetical protein
MSSDPASVADDWSAGARLYSGRVDPSWSVPAGQARALLATLQTLPASDRTQPRRRGLGYRGCWLRAPDGSSWIAADGLVAERSGAASAVRCDDQRAFERAVLATAPAGLLPDHVLAGFGR